MFTQLTAEKRLMEIKLKINQDQWHAKGLLSGGMYQTTLTDNLINPP